MSPAPRAEPSLERERTEAETRRKADESQPRAASSSRSLGREEPELPPERQPQSQSLPRAPALPQPPAAGRRLR